VILVHYAFASVAAYSGIMALYIVARPLFCIVFVC